MRITVATLTLGTALMVTGFLKPGMSWLSGWLGVDFFITGLAYAGFLPVNVYRKSDSGRIPPLFIILFAPLLLYTWSVWHLIRRINREPPFDRITADIIIGRRLLSAEIPPGVVNIVDLTVEFNEPVYPGAYSNYIFLPILDGSVPVADDLNRALRRLNEGVTYIHCAQGHGRTGLFSAVLLIHRGEVTGPEQALQLLKSRRPGLSLTRAQKKFLNEYAIKKIQTRQQTGLE